MAQTSRTKLCEKKIKTAELKILKILSKIHSSKLNDSYVSKIVLYKNASRHNGVLDVRFSFHGLGLLLVVLILSAFYWSYTEFSSESCLLTLPSSAKPAFRPPESCDACAPVRDVARVANITAHEFEREFAYSMQPVVVTGAARDWKAITEFNFNFFKDFYSKTKLGHQTNDCFYFAYKSGLHSLREVFDMDERRANLSGEPWYIGWSTCHSEETRRLRAFYTRPYFLPASAESDMVDWLFMGGPGQGAHMHVDSVRHMSWQAQVRGRKRWQLAPPPECLYTCSWISFDVNPGEILVVNTNRWYHMTNVLPGDISITIGAEYD